MVSFDQAIHVDFWILGLLFVLSFNESQPHVVARVDNVDRDFFRFMERDRVRVVRRGGTVLHDEQWLLVEVVPALDSNILAGSGRRCCFAHSLFLAKG